MALQPPPLPLGSLGHPQCWNGNGAQAAARIPVRALLSYAGWGGDRQWPCTHPYRVTSAPCTERQGTSCGVRVSRFAGSFLMQEPRARRGLLSATPTSRVLLSSASPGTAPAAPVLHIHIPSYWLSALGTSGDLVLGASCSVIPDTCPGDTRQPEEAFITTLCHQDC